MDELCGTDAETSLPDNHAPKHATTHTLIYRAMQLSACPQHTPDGCRARGLNANWLTPAEQNDPEFVASLDAIMEDMRRKQKAKDRRAPQYVIAHLQTLIKQKCFVLVDIDLQRRVHICPYDRRMIDKHMMHMFDINRATVSYVMDMCMSDVSFRDCLHCVSTRALDEEARTLL